MTKTKFIPLVIVLALLSAGGMFVLNGVARRYGEANFFGSTPPIINRGNVGTMMADPIQIESWGETKESMMYPDASSMPMPYYPQPGDALESENRAIEKFASYSVIVPKVNEYMKKTREYITSIGGRVLSYNQGTNDQYEYGYLTAKVPEDKFDEATVQVSKEVKKIIDESISAQDVTGQVVSVAETLQRLRDQKAQREADLLDAKTQADKKRIQLELDRLDRQIKQTEQTQSAVEERVNYSTISITVANKEYYFNGGPRPLTETLREAWNSLQGTGFGILAFLIWVLVYAIIWIPVLLLVRWLWGKFLPTAQKVNK